MYRLGTADLNGNLGLSKRPKEGVKWLKRSTEHATEEFPHALHELALLHERGVDNVVFVDFEYAAELLAQAAELGYAPSAYKLGECYEYGRMGCPQDAALSIHYYVSLLSSSLQVSRSSRSISAEHRGPAGASRGVLRSYGLVPRWLSGRASSIRYRGLPLGRQGRRRWSPESAVRGRLLLRGPPISLFTPLSLMPFFRH